MSSFTSDMKCLGAQALLDEAVKKALDLSGKSCSDLEQNKEQFDHLMQDKDCQLSICHEQFVNGQWLY